MSPGRITPWLIGAVLAVLTAGALGWATGAGSADGKKVLSSFMHPPVYQTSYGRGYGTLYTAVYKPLDASVELVWPGAVWRQSCTTFEDEVRTIRFNDGDSGGFAPTFKQGAVSR